MNPVDAFFAGIAPEHALALLAGLAAAAWLATTRSWRPRSLVDRWAGVLLGVSAAVHLALPLGGHAHHGPLVTAGFIASGGCFAWLAAGALRGRPWRRWSVPLVLATLVGYLVVVGSGEDADQVGIATALVELTVLGLAAVPARQPHRPRRLARLAGGAATVLSTFLVGGVIWAASFAAHEAAQTAQTAQAAQPIDPAAAHTHGHEHAGRAQAGVLMRVLAEHHPTGAQAAAAADLAARTTAAVAPYADLDAAFAAGYRMTLQRQGTDVHLEHPQYKEDGLTLDPRRPEMLVYAVDGGRASLLGVVYVMERAGEPGPAPGGPVTRWHSHNLCASALPPGIGVVSPYGGCPPFSVAVAVPEMMHVWTVGGPGGPFADGIDDAWIRAHHAEHGRPYTGG